MKNPQFHLIISLLLIVFPISATLAQEGRTEEDPKDDPNTLDVTVIEEGGDLRDNLGLGIGIFSGHFVHGRGVLGFDFWGEYNFTPDAGISIHYNKAWFGENLDDYFQSERQFGKAGFLDIEGFYHFMDWTKSKRVKILLKERRTRSFNTEYIYRDVTELPVLLQKKLGARLGYARVWGGNPGPDVLDPNDIDHSLMTMAMSVLSFGVRYDVITHLIIQTEKFGTTYKSKYYTLYLDLLLGAGLTFVDRNELVIAVGDYPNFTFKRLGVRFGFEQAGKAFNSDYVGRIQRIEIGFFPTYSTTDPTDSPPTTLTASSFYISFIRMLKFTKRV